MTLKLIEQLQLEKNFLEKAINEVKPRLKKSPGGSLHIVKYKNKYPQYYLYEGCKNKDKKPQLLYLGREKIDEIKRLAQAQYDKKILSIAEKQLKCVDKLIKLYKKENIYSYTENLPNERIALIKPIVETDSQYIIKWQNSFVLNKNTYPLQEGLVTENGELVRSKSEVIIANKLKKYKIPYVYEPMIKLSSGTYYPDFALLNIKRRKTIYLEHFGMVDNASYAETMVTKINTYEKDNICIGDNLIFTMETSETPLNISVLERMLKRACDIK